ncbi:MAG: M13 family metallopeptidase [Eubacterium sp.]|nr:M13 family metallopeptidase [Eubacterium sp.]
MKKGFRNFVIGTTLISMIVSPIGTSFVKAEEAGTEPEKQETEIRPQDDFYGYMNEADLRDAEVDPKFGYGKFAECNIYSDQQQRALIDNVMKSSTHTSTDAKLIADYYDQVINYSGNNSNADSDFENAINEISSISSMTEMMEMFGKYEHDYSVFPLAKFSISNGYTRADQYSFEFELSRTILGYSNKTIANTEDGRTDLRNKVKNVLIHIGYDNSEARKKADDFTAMAVDIAYHSLDERLIYDNVLTLNGKEMKEMGFDTESFSKGMGVENPYDVWAVFHPESFKTISANLSDEKNLENFKIWLLLEYADKYNYYLSDKYNDLKLIFGEVTEEGDLLAKNLIMKDLEDPLGRLYKAAYYPKEKDDKIRAMCEDIRQSYRELIGNADWLTQDGRDKLLKKLENIEYRTGGQFGDDGLSSESLIGADLYETHKNILKFRWDHRIEKLKTKREKEGSVMTPQTVNACYWVDNVVVIPAGIQNGVFFDENGDYYSNLGGLGMVIAHEVGHAFDSNCMKWDADGNLNPEWLNEEDRNALTERANMCIDYYSKYTIMDVYHVDGVLTLGENYADIGALECISNIAQKKEDLQTMYKSFGLIWRRFASDVESLQALASDEHSPAIVRVNAPLSSCDKFYEAFDVKEGDGMYVSPEERVKRW